MADINYISPNALTMIEYQKLSQVPQIRAISKSFIEGGHVGTDIPFLTDGNPTTLGSRWIGNVPDVNWNGVNSPTVVVKSVPQPYQEQKWAIINAIQISKYYKNAKNNIGNIFKQETGMYTDAVTFDFNDKFYNNDPTSPTGNAQAIVGIFPRIQASAGGVTGIYGVNPECYRPSAGVDMTKTGVSAAGTNDLIDQIQEMLYAINADEGTSAILYMNQTLIARLEMGIRQLGAGAGWTTDKDGYDRSVTKYKNAMIRNCGRKRPTDDGVQNLYNISSTQNSDGTPGTSNCTSIAAVKAGVDTFCFTQFEEMQADEPIKLPDGVTWQANFNWMVGVWQQNTRAIAQLPGIQIS